MSSFSHHQNNPNKTAKATISKTVTTKVNPVKANISKVNTPKVNTPKVNTAKVHNRIRALMEHTTRYAFKGEARLAADSGVSKSALNRLLNGHSSPSFALVALLTKALEAQLSRGTDPKHLDPIRIDPKRIDPRDLVSLDGTYPTPSVCALAGCRGCLPTAAYDENEVVRPEYRDVKPGQWALSKKIPSQSGPQKLPSPEGLPSLLEFPALLEPVEIFAVGHESEDKKKTNPTKEKR